ncbi:uncharacterized protein BO95DRAFT_445092 [Aspergillus brunneoviolaceus CBS 621.78]|uniref:Uncharacterized protein n=1 Tax=Aspergillus brunneoviolaceus CBS 621.78 TaxID=1450534 RepID=A0ACD1G2Z6_9EURO|nr:hypothetical protein BO95DRAFT_445092 [Aspergillus brunneoviolaceus CBS 621.78]RAH43534.1 hypothetical protein BO95DRAFT_445092 [Aspergillus brunneoviolaceus CBS 621.78]
MSPGTEQQELVAFTLILVVLVATTPLSTQRGRRPRLLSPLLYDAGARSLSVRAGFICESPPGKYIWPPYGPSARNNQHHI